MWVQILFLKFFAQLLYFLNFFQNLFFKTRTFFPIFPPKFILFIFDFFTSLIYKFFVLQILYIDLLYLNIFVQVN
jgi:hypothetical protein